MNHNIVLLDSIHDAFGLTSREINSYPPLTLAYLGDAVYEIIIRTLIVEEKERSVNAFHRRSSRLVNAGAQAGILTAIEDLLQEDEANVYRRGRNAKSHTVAKNASVHDYRMATGLEALMGYLYLTGNMNRAIDLIRIGLEKSGLHE